MLAEGEPAAAAAGGEMAAANPVPRWGDFTEGLTLYDRERPARQLRKDETIKVALKDVRDLLSCPICLGVIQIATLGPCTHRFCKECIETSLRNTKNECPLCRVHIATKRAMRDDVNFDRIISSLYPNLKDFEDLEYEKMTGKMPKQATAMSKATMRGMDRQQSTSALQGPPPLATRAAARPKSGESSSSSRRMGAAAPSSSLRAAKVAKTSAKDEDYFFVLRRHPREVRGGEKPPTREYIRTNPKIRISHLKQFLKSQFASSNPGVAYSEQAFKVVYVNGFGIEHVLPSHKTLLEVVEEFKSGDLDSDLVLHYHFIPGAANTAS